MYLNRDVESLRNDSVQWWSLREMQVWLCFLHRYSESKLITEAVSGVSLSEASGEQPVHIPGRHTPTSCHTPFASYPDDQGTLWHHWPAR